MYLLFSMTVPSEEVILLDMVIFVLSIPLMSAYTFVKC